MWWDESEPATTVASRHLNTGPIGDFFPRWGIELLNPAGQIADRITWGSQIDDMSIGRIGDGSWKLLSVPTRGTVNAPAAAVSSVDLVRVNEWFWSGFIEVFNPGSLAVDLGGLWLSDEPSEAGRRKWQIPARSFVHGGKHAVFHSNNGVAHPMQYPFELAAGGEFLRLSRNDATTSAIDSVGFGLVDTNGISQGRLPDGSDTISLLTPTPGFPNGSQNGLVFTLHPLGGAVLVGQPFSLHASAPAATSVQWHRNGSPIPLATGNDLEFSAVSPADDATYTCVATNASGSISSQPARA